MNTGQTGTIGNRGERPERKADGAQAPRHVKPIGEGPGTAQRSDRGARQVLEGVRKAVVLVSGGLDSATVLAMAKAQGYAPYAISFDYGQRHRVELAAARKVAAAGGALAHKTVRVDLSDLGGSALTDAIDVPKGRSAEHMGDDIPVTYVPARNTVFLALALAYAEVLGAFHIFVGANAIDYSGYPDCRPEFLGAFENLANLATKAGAEGGRFTIHAPLIRMTKADIIREGIRLGVDYGLTHSCYDPDEKGRACGQCDSCILRRRGFVEAGQEDPTVYSMP
ncbi:MAG: 7-cyano-7-deazaguanine synthase QueC [Nitrospirae bacterium]|nr:7-cyano-7-deazaguanine synthase QueC [Nitrospirota bacterium]